ncbi:sulfur-oxidizing protein SoxY [Palleronia aestuarii]|uniref:Sulfur-oxidizing protein SoxY n=1 Tax=Palleronia aestuarii TaxID=568105 RepID=A0A2W7NI39_9RHOB|nr:thiosulfate oxidation carrier protein SoxY [Palleronia aestuarii]PZX12816.1 sulfur-oxidizing protein SoxY [Palleronia aestuarii]
MYLSRRQTMALGTAALVFGPRIAWATATDDAIAEFTGGADVAEATGLTLTAPEIAENGNTVPIEVDAPGAESIIVLASGNPNPDVGTFAFGPLAASQMASTRIRLAGTQDVVAVAKMADGTFQRASQEVKVTIGGCGG